MSGLSITEYFPFMRMKITKQSVHGEKADSALIKPKSVDMTDK